MLKTSLYRQALVLNVLLLSGCEVANNAQRDFSRLVHGNPFSSASTRPASGTSQAYTSTSRTATTTTTTRSDAQAGDPAKPANDPKAESQQAAQFDVTLTMTEAESLSASLEYNSDLFERATQVVSRAGAAIPAFLQPILDEAGQSTIGAERLTVLYRAARRALDPVRLLPQTHKLLGLR